MDLYPCQNVMKNVVPITTLGRAGLEALCDPENAYGVTGSMKGSIDDLGGEMFW